MESGKKVTAVDVRNMIISQQTKNVWSRNRIMINLMKKKERKKLQKRKEEISQEMLQMWMDGHIHIEQKKNTKELEKVKGENRLDED